MSTARDLHHIDMTLLGLTEHGASAMRLKRIPENLLSHYKFDFHAAPHKGSFLHLILPPGSALRLSVSSVIALYEALETRVSIMDFN